VEVTTKKKDESDASPGALFSSGLIAAGGVFGLLAIVLRVVADAAKPETFLARLPDWLAFGPKHWALLAFNEKLAMPTQAQSLLGCLCSDCWRRRCLFRAEEAGLRGNWQRIRIRREKI